MVVSSTMRMYADRAQDSLASLSVSSTIDVQSCLRSGVKKGSTRKRLGSEKRVRFSVGANKRVVAEVITYKCDYSQFNSELYWTQREIQEFRNNARNVLVQMHKEQPELIRRIKCVLNQCGRWSDSMQIVDDRSCTLSWIKSNGRGLEALLSRHGSQARRAAVNDVLLCQSILQDQGTPPAEMSIALHDCSVHSTSRSRRVALQLGEFDALAANRSMMQPD
jgi:hypothetical protein